MTVTVEGVVTVDSYNFGPMQNVGLGDTVTVSFTVSTPGTVVVPGAQVDYDVDAASFTIDSQGSIAGQPSGASTLTIDNDNPDDGFDLSTSLSNGDFFGCEFRALTALFGSPLLEDEGGSSDLTSLTTSSNMRFTGAGGFLGLAPQTLTVETPPAGYCIELTGTVSSNSYSSGPLAGAAVGDTVVLSYCVAVPGTPIAPGQLVNYAIDLATFDFNVNGSTGLALAGPTDLQIQNDFPAADGFRLTMAQLATGEFFASGFGAVGTFFSSVDITMLAGTYDVAANLTSFNYAVQGGGGFFEVFPETLVITAPALGTNYCGPAVANSTGSSGLIAVLGNASVAANDLTLMGSALPANQFSFFLNSQSQGFVPMPGGSQGNICLSGAVGRYNGPGQVQSTGSAGTVTLPLDLAQTPTPTGAVAVQAGETWNFQLWYRDLNPNATSNFTDAVQVTFE